VSVAGLITEEQLDRAMRLVARGRALLGIVGQPGSGKSTLSAALLAALDERGVRTALVGMDGFHIAHRALTELGPGGDQGSAEHVRRGRLRVAAASAA